MVTDLEMLSTPTGTQAGTSSSSRTQKNCRKNSEMDKSPSFSELEESLRNVRTKVLNLEIENESKDKLIADLSDKVEGLMSRIAILEKKKCECRCTNTDFQSEIASQVQPVDKLCWKTAVTKSIKGKTNQPKPLLEQTEINVVNTVMVEQAERELKSVNAIIFGIELSNKQSPSERKDDDSKKIDDLCTALKFSKYQIVNIVRFNSRDPSKYPPILVKFNNSKARDEFLYLSRKLHKINEKFKNVFINPDLTNAERVFFKQLRDERNSLNESEDIRKTDFKWIIKEKKLIRVKKFESQNEGSSGRNFSYGAGRGRSTKQN